MAEQPALNRIHVVGYSANDRNFPILNLVADPRVAGYRIPEDLSACPDKRYPNHVFTGAQPIAGDQRVRHTWEILPSPWVPFTRYDDDLGPVQGRRRSVKNEGQVAIREADKQVTYEAREGSAIVYTELEETWSIKTDEDGNSLFPIRDRDFYDASRGPVQERRQLFVPTGEEEGSLENVNGVITQTSYEPYNEFLSVKIVQTYKVNGPQLIGNATNDVGQLVTVTAQRKAADGYIAPQPTATRTVEANREDAETLVERIVDAPEVFSAKTFAKEANDPAPAKFKVAVPTTTLEENLAGEAQEPTLGNGDISKSEQQINKFVKRIRSTFRSLLSLPKTLTQKATDNDGQLVSVKETLQVGDTTEQPTATKTVESEALGDGTYVVRTSEVPSIFKAETFRKTREDITPQKFKAAQENTTLEQTVEGTAQSPSLNSGEFEKSEQQINKFLKRISTTSRNIKSSTTLSEKVLSQDGQVGTRTLTLVEGDQSFTPSSTLIDASVESLGDGRTIKTETRVPKVFSNKTIRSTKEDLTPQKFRAKQAETTTEENVVGEISSSLPLEENVFSRSEEQITQFVKRIARNTRDISTTTNLKEYVFTPQGQIGERILTLSAQNQTISPDALTIDGSIEALGDGRTVKAVTKVPSVFPDKFISVEKIDTAPPKFRAESPIQRIQETTSGDVANSLSLKEEEISKSEQQLTVFTKKTTTDSRPKTQTEVTLSGMQTGTWGKETITETYGSDSTLETGFGILSNKKIPLGSNKFLGEKIQVDVSGSSTELIERKKDADTRINIEITKKLVPASTALPAVDKNSIAEIVPIDKWNSIQIITSVKELPEQEVFNTTLNYTYPDELTEVGIDWEVAKDQGEDFDQPVNTDYIVDNELSWNFSHSVFAASSIRGSTYIKIKQGYSGPVECKVTRKYYKNPPTQPITIKDWGTVYGSIVLRGNGLLQRTSQSSSGIGETRTKIGRGRQVKIDTFANTIVFGPVVHANISLKDPKPQNSLNELSSNSANSVSLPSLNTYSSITAKADPKAEATLYLPSSGQPPQSGYRHTGLVKVEKWRFNVWVEEVYEMRKP